MPIKFSEDIVPLTDLKVNTGKVVQNLDKYEKGEEERRFIKAVATGLMEVREGKELVLDKVRKKLGIAYVQIFVANSAYSGLEAIRVLV